MRNAAYSALFNSTPRIYTPAAAASASIVGSLVASLNTSLTAAYNLDWMVIEPNVAGFTIRDHKLSANLIVLGSLTGAASTTLAAFSTLNWTDGTVSATSNNSGYARSAGAASASTAVSISATVPISAAPITVDVYFSMDNNGGTVDTVSVSAAAAGAATSTQTLTAAGFTSGAFSIARFVVSGSGNVTITLMGTLGSTARGLMFGGIGVHS